VAKTPVSFFILHPSAFILSSRSIPQNRTNVNKCIDMLQLACAKPLSGNDLRSGLLLRGSRGKKLPKTRFVALSPFTATVWESAVAGGVKNGFRGTPRKFFLGAAVGP
jgi:hypothetical protein